MDYETNLDRQLSRNTKKRINFDLQLVSHTKTMNRHTFCTTPITYNDENSEATITTKIRNGLNVCNSRAY